jgi:hypothetical protein
MRTVRFVGKAATTGKLRIGVPETYGLTLSVGSQTFVALGLDFLTSLTDLRLQLEAEGLLICVMGACLNVSPSGMSSQMSAGRAAYRLQKSLAPDYEMVGTQVDIASPNDTGCTTAGRTSWRANTLPGSPFRSRETKHSTQHHHRVRVARIRFTVRGPETRATSGRPHQTR